MKSPNNSLGRYGEEVAARRLAHEGLHILERNWRCVEGELDIVALDGDTLAICEVKTRSENAFQQPTEGIDRPKADRLRRLAERWLAERWPTYFELLAERVTYLPRSDGLLVLSRTDGSALPDLPGRDGADHGVAVPAAAAGARPKLRTAAKRAGKPSEERSGAPDETPTGGKGRTRRRTTAKGGSSAPVETAALRAGPPTPPPPGGVRIDLVAVVNRVKGAARVEHLRGAV
ncbi:YraN family protein [Streptomyces sp. NRRL B-24484]|uniref:YraN family protein n=1 Tax=Streptomyces sp. NRRL B-24484 TaxID=1463833 RepID=UPI000A76CD47|nr:YraN family protein [Streptomyces sp. NRRL B-24484]